MRLNKDKIILLFLSLGVVVGLLAITAGFVLRPAQPAHAATTYTVTTNADSGAGSLRQAIIDANANAGADIIEFNIAGAGPHTIQPTSPLPPITDQVDIDATTTQTGWVANSAVAPSPFNGTIAVELDGSLAGSPNVNGLAFVAGSSGSSVRGLAINRFSFDGIQISNADNITVAGNYIGTSIDGLTALGNGARGVGSATGSATNTDTIGGLNPADRNIISGNTDGAGGNNNEGVAVCNLCNDWVVQGNYIGVDATGLVAMPNEDTGVSMSNGSTGNTVGGIASGSPNVISGNVGDGIYATESSTIQGNFIGTGYTGLTDLGNTNAGINLNYTGSIIGGTTAAARNIVSGNNADGIDLNGGTSTDTNIVEGNYIGTDINGTADLGNTAYGVAVFSGATNNTIGGTSVGARNIISGNNNAGLIITGAGTSNNVVEGNYIGTDVNGTADLGNTNQGVFIEGSATANTIGGTSAGARNIISGNNATGIELQDSGTSTNTIEGNYIGTDVNGTADLGNSFQGVFITNSATANTIGGTSTGARNIISGNNAAGIELQDSGTSTNTIEGNYIGTDVNGTADLGNSNQGVFIDDSAASNTIGGSSAGARNIISGNNNAGVYITTAANTNLVQGNFIGTDATGLADIGNTLSGVTIDSTAASNIIGGTSAGARNVISGNTDSGVQIGGTATSNTIQGNFIGTDATGLVGLANGVGVEYVSSGSGNVLGGTASGARNIISGNTGSGLLISSGGSSLLVQGNYFGLDANGTAIVANLGTGTNSNISLSGASNNTIGGNTAAARNIVSGTPANGIVIFGTTPFGGVPASNNVIQGNYIGTNASGQVQTGFGNSNGAIFIASDSQNNLVGGTATGEGNVIAGNGGGVGVTAFLDTAALNNSILGNSIYNNTGGTITSLGIDLLGNTNNGSTFTDSGVTANDAGDPDVTSNVLMNFPVISAVTSTNGTATITYNLDINNAEPGALNYRVEFFANDAADPSGHGEGQTYLGSDTIAGDVTGRQATITLPSGVSGSKYITATTTMIDASADGFGHTSEFTANVQATLVPTTNPITSLLAATGRYMKWILPIALLLITSGAMAIFILRKKSNSNSK